MIIVTSSFSKCSAVQNRFLPQESEMPLFANSSGLKSVFEKPCFGDGLKSWVFQISPVMNEGGEEG